MQIVTNEKMLSLIKEMQIKTVRYCLILLYTVTDRSYAYYHIRYDSMATISKNRNKLLARIWKN